MVDALGKSGQIYFIREIDPGAAFSPFVKIGLVRSSGQRNPFDRLSEHQTGNPRMLHLDPERVVDTHAVDAVEAMLHREFATRRVNGEWFAFESDEGLEAAVARTRDLAGEVEHLIPIFTEAERLKSVASNDEEREPTEEDQLLHWQLAVARAEIAAGEALQARISDLLVRAVEVGVPIKGVADTVSRTYSPRFQEAALRDAHPDLHKQYLDTLEPEWKGQFRPAPRDPVELRPETASVISAIDALLHEIEERSGSLALNDVISLNDPNLQLEKIVALASWENDIAVARLKVALGEHEAITGVCRWKRTLSPKTQFNALEFAKHHPELAAEFTTDPRVVEYVVRSRKRTRGGPTERASASKGTASTNAKRRASTAGKSATQQRGSKEA